MDRLQSQIEFLLEIDKLKHVFRQSLLLNQSRQENDAEHTWHLAMFAIMLSEYANEPDLDVMRVVKMLLIHDLVEIDAGDTYCYDAKGYEDKEEREQAAAKRLFHLLPEDQATAYHALWEEFERRETAESRFANACDRLQPVLLNYHTDGVSWLKHGIAKEQVMGRIGPIRDGSEQLWTYAEKLINSAVEKGFIKP